jgi:cytochrome b pre-mRNA-processing protein 3
MSGLGRIREAIDVFWPFRRQPEKEAAEALLGAVIAASRVPALYGPDRLRDEMEARTESAILYANLALIRLNGEDDARAVAQAFTDQVFRWLDSGLYEAGVGYQKVPKQMRALAARFYGRLEAYAAAIAARDTAALADALARNAGRTQAEAWPFAQVWAAHILTAAQRQAAAPWRDLALRALWPSMS